MTGRRRVGVYDEYWSTLGGGEQVAATIAATLAERADVHLLGPDPVDADQVRERLGIDVAGCHYDRVAKDDDASFASRDYDLFVNCTYRSAAVNQSAEGWYYVSFPGLVPSRRDAVRRTVAVAGARALAVPDRLPTRLQALRDGFDRRARRGDFVATYDRFVANSHYTAGWVERLWSRRADVLYPPVRPAASPGTKAPIILNVGRFFDPTRGHSKKQLELTRAFLDDPPPGWRLHLVGGADGENREYVLATRRAALGGPVDVHVNARGDVVDGLFAAASIYWHGGGYGEDPERHPERFEHFGITVVEAMAAGAVPVVFGAGGPAEIVEHGRTGFHWHTLEELREHTRVLIADTALREELAAAARRRAAEFSAARFRAAIGELFEATPDACR